MRTLLTIRHTSSPALTFHSFSTGLLSPLRQQLTQTTRDAIFHHAPTVCENRVQWCQIHKVNHTHIQHTLDTLLHFRAKKPRWRHCNCFCLWSAFKAWYNHSAWLIFHRTLWYYHSVIRYTMLFSQSSSQTDRNTNSVRCGELAEGALVPLRAMPGHLGVHWSD